MRHILSDRIQSSYFVIWDLIVVNMRRTTLCKSKEIFLRYLRRLIENEVWFLRFCSRIDLIFEIQRIWHFSLYIFRLIWRRIFMWVRHTGLFIDMRMKMRNLSERGELRRGWDVREEVSSLRWRLFLRLALFLHSIYFESLKREIVLRREWLLGSRDTKFLIRSWERGDKYLTLKHSKKFSESLISASKLIIISGGVIELLRDVHPVTPK